MKKKFFVFLSLFLVVLVGCTSNDSQIKKIDVKKGEQFFNSNVDSFQYIQDLENFLSYDILSITENKPFTSDLKISAKFDENSSIKGGVDFSWDKFVKSHDLEYSDVKFKVETESRVSNVEPFDLSGDMSLLYKDNEMYVNLHNLDVFMGEGNMTAKMYTLLGDMIIDKWVNLEVHSGGVIEVDESDNKRLPYVVGTLKNVLKSERINEDSPNFLNGVAELIDLVNSRIDLGISTNELKMINHEISYFELGDESIQKEFTGSFEGRDSAFDLSFLVSKKGLEIYLYNTKEYDEEVSDYKDIEKNFRFLIKENKKSEYFIEFESSKLQQKLVDLKGKIEYTDKLKFSADFVLEPLEIIAGENISGELEGNIIKKSGESDKKMPDLTGNVVLWSELLSLL